MRSWGWGTHGGISAFVRRHTRELAPPLSVSAMWRHSEKAALSKPGGRICCVCFLHTKQFSDTSWVSSNSTQFWHCLPGDGIRSRRVGAQSLETAFPPSGASRTTRLLPVLLINQLYIRGSHTPSLLLINLLEKLTELRKTVTYNITGLL